MSGLTFASLVLCCGAIYLLLWSLLKASGDADEIEDELLKKYKEEKRKESNEK